MSESKFTPGPWFVGAKNDALFVIDKPPRPSTDDMADVPGLTMVVGPIESVANAHLIAAAPDLYAALEASVNECGCQMDEKRCPPCVLGCIALTKARGE